MSLIDEARQAKQAGGVRCATCEWYDQIPDVHRSEVADAMRAAAGGIIQYQALLAVLNGKQWAEGLPRESAFRRHCIQHV